MTNTHKQRYRMTPKGAYSRHKERAKARGVEFLLTFDEWWKIWTDSKRYPQRGHKQHQYVMCRCKDEGPYAVGNVYIALARRNLREGGRTRWIRTRHGRNYREITFADEPARTSEQQPS